MLLILVALIRPPSLRTIRDLIVFHWVNMHSSSQMLAFQHKPESWTLWCSFFSIFYHRYESLQFFFFFWFELVNLCWHWHSIMHECAYIHINIYMFTFCRYQSEITISAVNCTQVTLSRLPFSFFVSLSLPHFVSDLWINN